jgi:hypothetical protein
MLGLNAGTAELQKERRAEPLPVSSFQIVFTLPRTLRSSPAEQATAL